MPSCAKRLEIRPGSTGRRHRSTTTWNGRKLKGFPCLCKARYRQLIDPAASGGGSGAIGILRELESHRADARELESL
jgi:hypothetical protein